VRDFLERRLTDLDLDAFGVLDLLLERLLDLRRLGVRAFLGATSFASALGALGVLARRADRRREAFGVLDRLLDLRRFGVRLFLGFTSSSATFGALGVLALRREADRLRLLLAFGVLERRLVLREADLLLDDFGVLDRFLDRRRFGVLDFLGASASVSVFGALGVLALRREEVRRLDALGVLDRRLLLLDAERLLLDFGVLDRLLARRRLGVFDFLALSSVSVSALGALGVRAFRLELERRLALGVLDRRLDLRDADLLLLDLGVLERLFARRRLGVLDFFASPSTSGLGALGVRARRRDEERRLEALGVLERRRETDRLLEDLGVFDRFLDRRRLGVRDFFGLSSASGFGALGVLARRLTALRPFEALGVLDLRRLRRRRRVDRERLGALGVLDRRALLRFEALGVRLRLAFLVGFEVSGLRARFLIPISLFLFSSISALY